MERTSFSHRTIFIGLFVSVLCATALAGYIYQRYMRYTPSASVHLAQEASFAFRLDVQQGVVYGAFRSSFMPLLERGKEGRETRAKRLERATSLELLVDARELVYGEVPGGDWLLIAGGMFRSDGVVSGVQRMMAEEGVDFARDGDVIHHESGLSFGVSEDGHLILASSSEVLRVALDSSFGGSFGVNAEGALLHVETRSSTQGSVPRTVSVLPDEPFRVQVILPSSAQVTETMEENLERLPALDQVFPWKSLSLEHAGSPAAALVGPLSQKQFDLGIQKLATRVQSSLEKSLKRASK